MHTLSVHATLWRYGRIRVVKGRRVLFAALEYGRSPILVQVRLS